MIITSQHKTIFFVGCVLATMLFEFFNIFWLQVIFKPLMIISLFFIYFQKVKESVRLYEIGLLTALLSNIFFLDRENRVLLVLGVICTVIYLLIYIYLILKSTQKRNLVAVSLASIPFLGIATYQISLYYENLGLTFWPIIIGGFLICMYCGLSFYTFFLQNSRRTTFLLISGISMFFMATLFALEAFFIKVYGLRVGVIGSYALFQYSYMRFVVENEPEQEDILEQYML